MTETLARNQRISIPGVSTNVAWQYLQECYQTEEEYKQMIIDGKTKYALLDNFNTIEEKLIGKEICKTLSSLEGVEGLKMRNITKNECENV